MSLQADVEGRVRSGHGEQARDLALVVGDEVPDAVVAISRLGGPHQLAGGHEVTLGVRQQIAHQRDLFQGRRVEMAHPGAMELLQDLRLRIGLDREKHVAGKAVEEALRRATNETGVKAINRPGGAPRPHQVFGRTEGFERGG